MKNKKVNVTEIVNGALSSRFGDWNFSEFVEEIIKSEIGKGRLSAKKHDRYLRDINNALFSYLYKWRFFMGFLLGEVLFFVLSLIPYSLFCLVSRVEWLENIWIVFCFASIVSLYIARSQWLLGREVYRGIEEKIFERVETNFGVKIKN